MDVNDETKLLYIHIPKCGGSALKKWFELSGYNYPPQDDCPSSIHRTAWAAREIANGPQRLSHHLRWEEYITFATVRNPWAALVSSYFYKISLMYTSDLSTCDDHAHIEAVTKGFEKSFKAQNISTIDVPEGCTFPYSMMRWLTDESGTIMIDEILRLENIEEDVSGMCLKYDLKKPDITKSFSTKHLPYQCYFTEQWMIDWVAERNQDYIEHFGYEFA